MFRIFLNAICETDDIIKSKDILHIWAVQKKRNFEVYLEA